MVPALLAIKGLECPELNSIIAELKGNPELVSRIQAIEIVFAQDEDDFENATKEAAALHASKVENFERIFYDRITEVIERVAQAEALESFTWEMDSYNKHAARPQAFWDALGRTRHSLKHLNLGFSAHEIDKLAKSGVNPFPRPFTGLEVLKLDLSGAHGDDGKSFDNLLGQIHKLRSLTLDMPSCDLEDCRIKGMSYQWDFPQLTNLDISVYVDQASGLLEFFARHPSIRVLALGVDSDEAITITPDVFPDLRALRFWNVSGSETLNDILSSSRPIRHLHLASSICGESSPVILKDTAVLQCLELNSISWEDLVKNRAMSGLTAQYTGLQEFGLTFQSEDTSWIEDGIRCHPDPLDVDDLMDAMTMLSKCPLRAIRMTDNRSLPLPVSFTKQLPPCTPCTLEYIQWGDEDHKKLYKIHRTRNNANEETAVAVEFDGDTATVNVDANSKSRLPADRNNQSAWLKTSILDHLR